MLDMEIRKSQFAMQQIGVSEDQLAFDEICQTMRHGEDFLSSDHTLDHFRGLWNSSLFLTDNLSESWVGDEKAILDKCDQAWRENLKNYQPPEWPEDKMKALEKVLARAKKELLD